MGKRILFVGMVDSPHLARWINQLVDLGWDIHVFPVYHAAAHQMLKGVTIHRPWIQIRPRHLLKSLFRDPKNAFNVRESLRATHPNRLEVRSVWPLPVATPLDRILVGYKGERLGESKNKPPLFYGPKTLARLIQKVKPDLIHSMEFQHAGYLVLKSKELVSDAKFPKWMATNWGSDIFYYRKFPDHKSQISRLLQSIDYYSCECERDIGIAREMGLKAPSMPVMPNAGGFNIEALSAARSNMKPADRKIVMVKGYEHFAGRGLTALDAIQKCADALRGFRVVVFSAGEVVRERIEELRMFYGIDISVLEHASHEKMLKYFAHARAYLGVSVSDGISTSMIESMAFGCFPIQTDTACCTEWFQDGTTGFSIKHDDVDGIAAKLRTALTDDELVNNAEQLNWETVTSRLDQSKLKLKAREIYNSILN